MLQLPSPVCRSCKNALSQSGFLRFRHSAATPKSGPFQRALTSHLTRTRTRTRSYYQGPSGKFEPLTPPDPSKLPKPKPKTNNRTGANNGADKQKRKSKWPRRVLLTAVVVLPTTYLLDHYFNASSLARTTRTFYTGILVAVDYKVNFRPNPPFAESLEALHARNAQRVFDMLAANGGLYLKMGQAIGMQSAVLPPQFQAMFARMFDDAPQNEWADVEKVVREDFGGKGPEEVFGVMVPGNGTGDGIGEGSGVGALEKKAMASASIAQVHWARLPDGREVAIKIQKREIAKQIEWDLWAFKVVTWIYTWLFEIPMYNMVPYISERIMLETDFENEARNSEKLAALIAKEPRLRNRVYIPRVYHELSSKRVMTAEWIEGVRLWDKDTITRAWKGGSGKGSPGCDGMPLDPSSRQPVAAKSAKLTASNTFDEESENAASVKPQRDWWRGIDKTGGLGLQLKDVMGTIMDVFSAQMFLYGFLHCDPHPGNIFVRRRPNGRAQVVLIDHGLYIQMSPRLRHQYALLWKSLLALDNKTIAAVAKQWGVANTDAFASMTLLRPYEGGDLSTMNALKGDDLVDSEILEDGNGSSSDSASETNQRTQAERAYAMQQKVRKGIKQVLADETRWPRELLFISRSLRILQLNNQHLGSPVNRIKTMGLWASGALAESRDLSARNRLRYWIGHLVFRMVLFGTDVAFWYARVKRRWWLGVGGGMEDEIEERMRQMAKGFGVELNHAVFEG